MTTLDVLPPGSVLPPMNAGTDDRRRDRPQAGKRRNVLTGNRFAVLNTFVDYALPSLGRADAMTWLVLYRDTKADGTTRTSIADIARRTGANASTIKRAVKRLTTLRLLVVVYRGSVNRGPSRYRVLPPQPPRSPPA